MKRIVLLYLMLPLAIASIHAQESAFEVLLPYRVDFLNASFCRETSDGNFLVIPGSDCKILKLSQDGMVMAEITYIIDSVNKPWTWFGQLIDIPNFINANFRTSSIKKLSYSPKVCIFCEIVPKNAYSCYKK